MTSMTGDFYLSIASARYATADRAISITVCALSLEASAAVHGAISAGLEGHLGGAAAAIADHFVHLTRSAVAAVLSTTSSTASGAAAGLILEALLGEESLLGSGEHEFVAAVTAGQGLILVHSGNTSFILHPYHVAIQLLLLGVPTKDMRDNQRRNDAWLGYKIYYIMQMLNCTVLLERYFFNA